MRSALAAFLLLPATAGATALQATYEVHAAGMTILELEARFELNATGYRIDTRFRTRGMAATFAPGEQTARARGTWSDNRPAPAEFVSEGAWRGRPRRIALAWQGQEPRVIELTPPETEEREPIPPALRTGTVDVLSALAGLSRQVAERGACDLATPVYDGRRRSDYAARTESRDLVRPWRSAWHGEALRCAVEFRVIAGFRRDQDRAEAGAPQRSIGWIAAPYPGAPPIPVRIDIPTRWFGTVTAVLLRAQPLQQRAELGR